MVGMSQLATGLKFLFDFPKLRQLEKSYNPNGYIY